MIEFAIAEISVSSDIGEKSKLAERIVDGDQIKDIGLNRFAVGSSINEKTASRGIVPLLG
jgi:hypothetical protein